mgnify:CR=1 FL=1
MKKFIENIFLIRIIWVICFLIKNRGMFEINIQSDSFNNDYFVDTDNEDNFIRTDILQLINDIFWYNN